MNINEEVLQDVVIKFAGDSGDGMQLTGSQFTNNSAMLGLDLATFPDFPAEIRAPQGTLPGVSGFQLRFSSDRIFTPGDTCDVLVAMNAAALKTNLKGLKRNGKIIANVDGFDAKNLRLANYPDGVNPLENGSLEGYEVIKMDVTKMTREALKEFEMGIKEKDRAKNMFVLGFLYWMYSRSLDYTIKFLKEKFGKKEDILNSNIKALQAGYNFGDTTETFTTRYSVEKAKMPPGNYRGIMGNQAVAYGLIAASQKSGLPLFLGSYPITPASDILHELSRHKAFGVKTFQAEDEIAAITSAIGAAYGGSLGVTATSGPGMAILLRSATSNEFAAEKLREVFANQVWPVVGSAGAAADAGRRAGLVSSQLLGLAMCRYLLRLPPVVALSHDEIILNVGPTLQRYATGEDVS